jgi:peptidoglycan/xylan/chitin deacetylase (PgdA/CDA1 family)
VPDVLVLCYHAVSETWPAALSVTPDALDEQLELVASRGYRGARFTEAATGAVDRAEPTVVVTFDDAYRSVLELAKPILDRHGFPGTLFVPSRWPGDPGPMRWPGIDRWCATEHQDELRCLSWGEVRSLADDGWEIGSHTCSHPRLTEVDDGALARELRRSKVVLEAALDRPCLSLAYPYGCVDGRVEWATHEAGYRAAGAIPQILYRPRALRWPRTPIFHDDSIARFRLKVSPALRRTRRSALGTRLDAARVARTATA